MILFIKSIYSAIFLPTQHFAKAGKGKVWAESRKASK